MITLSPLNRSRVLVTSLCAFLGDVLSGSLPGPRGSGGWGVAPEFCVLESITVTPWLTGRFGSRLHTWREAALGASGLTVLLGLRCHLRFVDSGPRQGCTFREM